MVSNSNNQNSNVAIVFPEPAKPYDGFTIFVTGHMPDAPDRPSPRFPPANVLLVSAEMRMELISLYRNGPPISRLICSAAAGADLIAVAWAMDYNVKTEIFLRYDEESFIERSICYGQTGEWWWKHIYERAKNNMHVNIHVPQLASDPTKPALLSDLKKIEGGSGIASMELNTHMINHLKEGDVVIALWDGKGGDGPGGTDGTEHALRVAREQKKAKIKILKRHLTNVAEVYPTIA